MNEKGEAMNIGINLKRAAIVFLCAVIAIAFSAAVPGNQALAASKKKAPTKVTEYYKNDSGKWVKSSEITYKYNKKADVVKTARTVFYDDGDKHTASIKLKYTYKKGKKTKATGKGTASYEKYTFKYDKKNRLTKISESYEDGADTYSYFYGKKGYLKTVKAKTSNTEYTHRSTTYNYAVTLSGSTASKIVISGKDFYGDSFKIQQTFYGDGLMKTYVDRYDYVYNYTYKKSGGLVKERYESYTDDEGNKREYKTVYTYGKTKVKNAKYVKIINLDERIVVANLNYSS